MAETAAVTPGPVSYEHEGFTVRSNSGTVEDLQRDLGVNAPDQTNQPETQVDPGDEDPEPLDADAKPKARDIHKRIAKTTYEREEANRVAAEAKREADELKAENARLKAERERPVAEPEQPRRTEDETARYEAWKSGLDDTDPKPQVGGFDDHELYLDARDAWNERRIDRRSERAQAERQQFERHAAVGRAAENFKGRIDAEAAKDPAFAQAVQKIQIPGQGPLFDVFLSPKTPVEALVRHFDAHPTELAELIAMRPGQQLAEVHRVIGRLEARAEAAQAGSVERVKPTTKAHPPINPVAGSHVAAGDDEPTDDDSDEAFYAKRERQLKAQRKR